MWRSKAFGEHWTSKLNDASDYLRSSCSKDNEFQLQLNRAKTADILIHLIDVSKLDVQRQLIETETLYLNEELKRFGLENSTDKRTPVHSTIHVLNKIDLIDSSQRAKLDDLVRRQTNVISLSCETNENFPLLIDLISECIDRLIKNDNLEKTDDFITERHQKHLNQIVRNISLAIDKIDQDRAISSYYIENSINEIACITGSITTEQILDVLFRDFCIGK